MGGGELGEPNFVNIVIIIQYANKAGHERRGNATSRGRRRAAHKNSGGSMLSLTLVGRVELERVWNDV